MIQASEYRSTRRRREPLRLSAAELDEQRQRKARYLAQLAELQATHSRPSATSSCVTKLTSDVQVTSCHLQAGMAGDTTAAPRALDISWQFDGEDL